MTSDATQDVLHGRRASETGEFGGEELLQRLTSRVGSLLQTDVNIARQISDQYIGHACIMISFRSEVNRLHKEGLIRQWGAAAVHPMVYRDLQAVAIHWCAHYSPGAEPDDMPRFFDGRPPLTHGRP